MDFNKITHKIEKGITYYTDPLIGKRIEERIVSVPNKNGFCMSYTDLSYQCNMAKNSVYGIVKGFRRVKSNELSEIAKNLYVSEEWLLTGNGKIYDPPQIKKPIEILFENLNDAYKEFYDKTGIPVDDLLK